METVDRNLEGRLSGEGRRFAVVVSRFNDFITERLLNGALAAFRQHGAESGQITTAWVPGAFELPLASKRLAATGRFDAVVCIGAVIRGATPHFDLVCNQAASGVLQAGLTTDVPVIFGVITTDTIEQAVERAGTKAGNKGWDAAMAALEMADLLHRIGTA